MTNPYPPRVTDQRDRARAISYPVSGKLEAGEYLELVGRIEVALQELAAPLATIRELLDDLEDVVIQEPGTGIFVVSSEHRDEDDRPFVQKEGQGSTLEEALARVKPRREFIRRERPKKG